MADQVQHFSTPGGIIYSPASGHSQEMACWETRPRDDGSVTQGMINAARAAGKHHGVFEFQEFPKAMYFATQTQAGIKITDQMRVESAVEEANMASRGWRARQEDAIARVEADYQATAQAAAERAFTDRRMSEKARAEAQAADESTSAHVGAVPVTPIKRGLPRKVTVSAEG